MWIRRFTQVPSLIFSEKQRKNIKMPSAVIVTCFKGWPLMVIERSSGERNIISDYICRLFFFFFFFIFTNYRLERSLYVKLKDRMSNSVDPDETAHNEPSHLELRCLQTPISIACAAKKIKVAHVSMSICVSHDFISQGHSKMRLFLISLFVRTAWQQCRRFDVIVTLLSCRVWFRICNEKNNLTIFIQEDIIWASAWQNQQNGMCAQRRLRSAWASPPVWSESLLSVWRKLGFLATHWAHSEDSDQTGGMLRLIWVFAGRTCHLVGFVMRWLIC